jgi:hypothetical protein
MNFCHAVAVLDRAPMPQHTGHLRKHLAIEGGLLKCMADGAGAFTLDGIGLPTAMAHTVVRKERPTWCLVGW